MYNFDGRGVQLKRHIQESAKLNNLDVYGYLIYLLSELPKLGEKPDKKQLQKMLPWSETLPEYCRIPKRA